MPKGKFNLPASLEEAILLPAYLMALLIQVGIVAGSVYGIDFNSTLVSLGSTTISWTVLVSVGSVILAFAFFEMDIGGLDTVETISAAVAVLLPLAIAFVPALKDVATHAGSGGYVGPTVVVLIGAIGMAAMTYIQETSDEIGFSLSR